MATTASSINLPAQHPVKTSRRSVGLIVAAVLLVGASVATTAVIVNNDDASPAPAHVTSTDATPKNDPLVTRFGEPQGSTRADTSPQPPLRLSGPR
jgi:hypothetical protein